MTFIQQYHSGAKFESVIPWNTSEGETERERDSGSRGAWLAKGIDSEA